MRIQRFSVEWVEPDAEGNWVRLTDLEAMLNKVYKLCRTEPGKRAIEHIASLLQVSGCVPEENQGPQSTEQILRGSPGPPSSSETAS